MTLLLDFWLNPVVAPLQVILLIYLNHRFLRRGNILRFQGYTKFCNQTFYVVNPWLRDSIHNNKPIQTKVWFFWIFSVVFTGMLSIVSILDLIEPFSTLVELIIGLIICNAVDNVIQTLSTVYVFHYYREYPHYFSGQIRISPAYQYGMFRGMLIVKASTWLLIFLLIGRVFFLGGVVASFVSIIRIHRWQEQDSKSEAIY